MKIALAERFEQDVRGFDEDRRLAVRDAVLALPRALGEPHRHAGLGLRKLHPSGIWEARIGLEVRLVFTLEHGLLTLVRAGSHDDVRKYLRQL